jgi:acetyl-CoA acetyltransferase
MHTFGVGRETLAKVAVKNHYNGARNPKAHLRMEITEDKVLSAPMISYPFGLFDCCPTTDGAAAAIVCRADLASRFTDRPVPQRRRPRGDDRRPYFDPTFDYLGFRSTQKAAQQAYAMAGIRARTSTSPRCTTASPGPRSRTSRISASARKARAELVHEGRTALSGDCRSTRAAARSRSAIRSAPAACA